MLGTSQPKVLADFYQKVFDRPADMQDEDWHGWHAGSTFFSVGPHSEVNAKAKEPDRILFNFETDQVNEEFDRIAKIGATVIKEPYEMGGMSIATLADPDGNYFQLMSPWKE